MSRANFDQDNEFNRNPDNYTLPIFSLLSLVKYTLARITVAITIIVLAPILDTLLYCVRAYCIFTRRVQYLRILTYFC